MKLTAEQLIEAKLNGSTIKEAYYRLDDNKSKSILVSAAKNLKSISDSVAKGNDLDYNGLLNVKSSLDSILKNAKKHK